MKVAIVMPAWNAGNFLPRTLPAAVAQRPDELLVVDAGSTDGTAELAGRHGARVLRLPARAGPAEARNAGAREVRSEVVLFLDADCQPHRDVVERVRRAFAGDEKLVSLTGSYDDDPPETNFASLYMNLRHHFTHQRARREKAGFWAGCGAVRRSAFLEAGGFDARRYPRPMIEDIELGLRLAKLGRTALDPRLLVKHLKRWSLAGVIATDIRCRAVPWSRLILETGSMPDDLNLRRGQRLAAAVAPFALLSLPALVASVFAGNRWWVSLAAIPLALAAALNLELLRFFARNRGWRFALLATLFHQLHLAYSAATFALVSLGGRRRP